MTAKRRRIFSVSPELLVFIASGVFRVEANPLPEGTKIVGRHYDIHTDTFQILCEHESFDPVDPFVNYPHHPAVAIRCIDDEVTKLQTENARMKAELELWHGYAPLTVRDGDRVVITVKHRITRDAKAVLKESVQKVFPNQKILILEDDASLSVVYDA